MAHRTLTLNQWVQEIGGHAAELLELKASRKDVLYAKVRTDMNSAGVTARVPDNVVFTMPELNRVKNLTEFGLKKLLPQTEWSGVEFWP